MMKVIHFFRIAFIPVLLDVLPEYADYKGWLLIIVATMKTAFQEFKPLAEQGDAMAQLHLGEIYHQGQGVPKDYVMAYIVVQEGSRAGDGQRHRATSVRCIEKGKGVRKDDAKALKWL